MTERDGARWILHGEEQVKYQHGRWLTVGTQWIEKPVSGEREDHVAVTLPPAALVVLSDASRQNVLLTWRHRHVPNVEGWELPAGLLEDGESPAETARREVLEETGHEVCNLEHVTTFEPAVGSVRNPHHLYRGVASEQVSTPTEQDEGTAEWIPWDLVPTLISSGEVPNAGALIGLQHGLLNR